MLCVILRCSNVYQIIIWTSLVIYIMTQPRNKDYDDFHDVTVNLINMATAVRYFVLLFVSFKAKQIGQKRRATRIAS